MAAANLS